MTSHQQPLDSGFGHRSTASDVLAGIDLSGRTALVTGGYSGLGLATTEALVNAGAHVIVPARRPAKAHAALDGCERITIDSMDLADPDSVAAFTARLRDSETRLDMVIANAGIMACPETRTGQGWELQFAVNHLGHFAMVNQLWPVINDGARVVAVSSGAHAGSDIRWDDPHFDTGYDRWGAYSQSKRANVLFGLHLDGLGKSRNVRSFSITPGAILTPLQRHLAREDMVAAGWTDEDGNGIDPGFKTPEQGAATQVWAATSPLLDDMGGLFCENCDVAPVMTDGTGGGVHPDAINPESAARLWAMSVTLTGKDSIG